ncbi:hypothetical protein ILYODFUR_039043 [Ilyodon furcidens]|uniref:Uncharacterized protein n=1 Tax=Ilyodon furcidens TaxID=33524 RepID=A0ABV0TES0_9TELE
MSRKHKNGTEENLVESIVNPGVSYESEQYQSDMQIDPSVKDVISKGEDNEVALCVQLLMAHFGEDLSGLILLADVYATAADIETTLSLPASPRLILHGIHFI